MAYYSHNHNLAYDLTLFETPYQNKVNAKLKKKSSEDAAKADDAAAEQQEDSRTPGKKRVKSSRRSRKYGRIALAVVFGIAVMAVTAANIHGQVQLTELSQKLVDARADLAEKQSYYTQLEMKIGSSVSTTVVEQYARDHLKMNKANNSQKEFVKLSEGDKAEVSMSEDKGLFEKIGDAFTSLWS